MSPAQTALFPSISPLSVDARARLLPALAASLADGIDLYTQLQLAHWNVKGFHFAYLHQLFGTLADEASERNDELAERLVALGGVAVGSARQVARASRLDEADVAATDEERLLRGLLAALARQAEGLRSSRALAEQLGDADSEDLLTGQIRAVEKNAWFLQATLHDG
jgi:starvation-inducible DNA-binding protein